MVPLGVLLLAFGFVLTFRLGQLPLDSKREVRTWEVTEAMLDSGDWLVPRMEGNVRLVKPPLYYWTAAASSTLAGGLSRFWWRLPSALAALGLACLTWYWGRSVGGHRLGLCALALLSMMFLIHTNGRRGVAEMQLALFSNLALFGFDALFFRGRPGRLPLFALWVALAVLSKATVALMLIGLPIALVLLLHRRVGDAFRAPVVGWVSLGLLVGFAWYAVILAVVPGAWDTLRMAATLPLGVDTPGTAVTAKHYGPVWFYVGGLASAALPALFLLPWAIGRAARSRLWAADPRRRFLALIVLSLFVAFSLIPQKQKHYLLPLLPALAILMADSMLALLAEDPARGRRVLAGFGVALAAAGVLLGSVLLWFYGVVLGTETWILMTAAALGAGLALGAWRAGRGGHPLRLLGLATCGTLLFATVFYGSFDQWKTGFLTGTAQSRDDYDAARWSDAFERYPFLRAMLLPRDQQ